jgi:16S rRNA (uracil1498-N3)-methyltransferase
MQRYFGSIIGKQVLLSDEDAKHLVKVMRANPGEQIEIVNEGTAYLAEIKNTHPLTIEILSRIKEKRELENEVILIAALIKGDKLDYVLQKATELGVREIVLLSSERTIVKAKDFDSSRKLERYRRILKEAAMQSHRSTIPDLYRLITVDQLKTIKADVKMIAYEGEAGSTKSLWNAMKQIEKGNKIAVVIGPEGGFSEKEVNKAIKAGYTPVSLGHRILRAETASIYTLSVLSAYLEKK